MPTGSDPSHFPQHRFGQFADRYVTSEGHAQGSELDRLVAVAQPLRKWVALDVATGGGHTALKFAPLVARVIATDIAPNMLAAAQAFINSQGVDNVTFRHADAEELPFDDEIFDLVTCRIAPHHFRHCDWFVRECARVLKPAGMLLIQDHVLPEGDAAAQYIDDFERLRDPSHNRAYTEAEWREMFRETGLNPEHTEEVLKRHHLIPWANRQDCTPETIDGLFSLLRQAPAAVIEWMQPGKITDSPDATFVNHHIIIAGRKQITASQTKGDS